MTEKKKKWIRAATENKGALHRALGVPEGEKIPPDKLQKALRSKDPKIKKEAQLAETLKGMHHKRHTAAEARKKMYGK
jgi:hypothetical protein